MKIFVISLKSSVERRENVQKILDGENLKFEFFCVEKISPDSAIHANYNPEKTKKNKGYILTDSEIGCFASHRLLWEKSVELNEPIFILEDNIQVNTKLDVYLNFGIKNICKLEVLKYGAIFDQSYIQVSDVDDVVSVVKYSKGACGTSGYMIAPSAASKYLALSEEFFEPVDDFMDKEWNTSIPVYTLKPDVISRSRCDSVIGSRKDKRGMRWYEKIHPELYKLATRMHQNKFNREFVRKVDEIKLDLDK